MSSVLDMSLDDIIKNNKKSSAAAPRSQRPQLSASGPGPTRRPTRNPARPTPYSFPNDGILSTVRPAAIETGTKLYISNLDYGVSNDDIKELFLEVGELKRYTIHYDRSGRSKGSAEVVYVRRADAAAAIKRYNNVQLDGKPMKIELVGTNIVTPGVIPRARDGILGNPFNTPISLQGRGVPMRQVRGRGGRGGGGRGRGGRGQGQGRVTAEDLDADLEKYHSESMQIN